MMNKKGSLVLRDLIFMIIIFSGIITLSSILIRDMADNYEEYYPTNMSSEFNQNTIGEDQLESTGGRWEEIGRDLSENEGIIELIKDTIVYGGTILLNAITAPIIFANMLESILKDILPVSGATDALISGFKFMIIGLLYALAIFVILSAKLQGGKI